MDNISLMKSLNSFFLNWIVYLPEVRSWHF
jgi:hypothetical protein